MALIRAPALLHHRTEVCAASTSAEPFAHRNSGAGACLPSSSSSSSSSVAASIASSLSRSSQSWSRGVAIAHTRSRRAEKQPDRFWGCRAAYVSGSGALTPQLKEALDNFVSSNKVVLFMKGNRNFPQCGFSNTCVQILNQFNVPYETVNILEDESLRQGVKEYSNWPTYPQLYIAGEFFGGCDIALDAYQSGELKEAIDKAIVS